MTREKTLKKKHKKKIIILVFHQYYHVVHAINSSMQELVYFVLNSITIKEAISKEEIKFLDTRDKAADNIQVTYKAAVKE